MKVFHAIFTSPTTEALATLAWWGVAGVTADVSPQDLAFAIQYETFWHQSHSMTLHRI